MFSLGTFTSRNTNRPVAVPRIPIFGMRASRISNPDGVMRINKNRRRCATAPDFFQDFTVSHLRETASAIFLRRGHTKHTDASEAIDHAARNICLPINLRSIEVFIEKLAKFAER